MTVGVPAVVAGVVAAIWCAVILRPTSIRGEAGRGPGQADGGIDGSIDGSIDPAARASAAARRNELLLQVLGLSLAGFAWFGADRSGLALAILAPWTGVVLLMRRRREERERIAEETSALETIAAASRALRAGIPIPGIFSILAAEGRGTAGRCFREIVRRESLGEDLGSALRRVLLASPVTALRAFGLALIVHGEAGGNLADSADRLARSLVERSRVRRRARTIMTYARAAGMLLAVMPVVVLVLMCASVEGYQQFVFERPVGNLLVGISAVLVMLGVLAMQRISRIEREAEGVVR